MEYVYLVRIYLDNAATTPALPEVCDLVVRCLRDRPTPARVTRVDADFQFRPRIIAIQIG